MNAPIQHRDFHRGQDLADCLPLRAISSGRLQQMDIYWCDHVPCTILFYHSRIGSSIANHFNSCFAFERLLGIALGVTRLVV